MAHKQHASATPSDVMPSSWRFVSEDKQIELWSSVETIIFVNVMGDIIVGSDQQRGDKHLSCTDRVLKFFVDTRYQPDPIFTSKGASVIVVGKTDQQL